MRSKLTTAALILLTVTTLFAVAPTPGWAGESRTKQKDDSGNIWECMAKAAAKYLIEDAAKHPEKYKKAWSTIVSVMGSHHKVYGWTKVAGKTVCVVPCGGGGSRLTYNIAHGPFDKHGRRVEFHLLNVRSKDRKKVYWEVKSDVPGRPDGHRQVNDRHKTRDGETIGLDKRAGKDYAYYCAGRWKQGLSNDAFFKNNPKAAILLILR